MTSSGGNSDGSDSGSNSAASAGWTTGLKNWRSILPGYGSKSDEDNTVPDPDPGSHQVTDYQEGERRDIHGNRIQLGNPQTIPAGTLPQSEGAANIKDSPHFAIKDQSIPSPPSIAPANIPTRHSVEPTESKVEEVISKAVAKRRKNVVLPDYYEQFPDVLPSLLLTVPVGSGDVAMISQATGTAMASMNATLSGRVSSMMRGAVNAVRSLLFLPKLAGPAEAQPGTRDTLQRGTQGIRKVVIVGVHGWYPRKAIRTVIGEPTGTSKKFCDEMQLALQDYLRAHGKHLEPKDVTIIPLEGEGKVLDRVELLHQSLIGNQAWKDALHEADLVLVATHSQGTPTSVLLVARWIQEGLLRVKEDDPRMQRIGILAMAGVSHGPFPFLKGNLIVRWFEAEAAGELFEFMDSETRIARKYQEGLRIVLSSGVRLTCVASLEDQVVPLYSAVMTSIHHPSIVRAVYIDAASYQNDFLINLIAFSLRLRNAGVDDHGILVHLSEVIAGSLYGEGHSTIYEEREVYLLSIRSLLEPPAGLTSDMARSEPILHPFRAKQRLNPFYLPWGMRGIADEIMARGDQVLIKELERLKKLYIQWNPVTKGMKEIKYRLEPVRSKL